ncbi:MAG: Rpp14/Pop5 family protein [Candidatus Woesearchaeota archaeon]
MKSLLPTLREKKRYVAFEIISDRHINQTLVADVICQGSWQFMGTLEAAKAGVQMPKYNPETMKGVLRVGNKHTDQLKAALLFINEIGGEQVIIRSISTSGMLNKLGKHIAA